MLSERQRGSNDEHGADKKIPHRSVPPQPDRKPFMLNETG
jgi:hypothetical protein